MRNPTTSPARRGILTRILAALGAVGLLFGLSSAGAAAAPPDPSGPPSECGGTLRKLIDAWETHRGRRAGAGTAAAQAQRGVRED